MKFRDKIKEEVKASCAGRVYQDCRYWEYPFGKSPQGVDKFFELVFLPNIYIGKRVYRWAWEQHKRENLLSFALARPDYKEIKRMVEKRDRDNRR